MEAVIVGDMTRDTKLMRLAMIKELFRIAFWFTLFLMMLMVTLLFIALSMYLVRI